MALEVAKQSTYPGYGYWLENGLTTLPEEWSGENSHNHQMFGSISEYFYKYLAGIQSPMEGNTSAGYQHIHLQPFIPDGLNAVKASVETVAGTIVSDWNKEEGSFSYHVSIPANTTASVVIPYSDDQDVIVTEEGIKIWENGRYIDGVSGIKAVEREADLMKITIESGDYAFEIMEML